MNQTVRIEFEDLPYRGQTRTPTLAHCRRMLREGYPEDTKLEVCRNGRVDLIVHNIGEAAKLTIKENPTVRFVEYDFKRPVKGVHLPLSIDLNEEERER